MRRAFLLLLVAMAPLTASAQSRELGPIRELVFQAQFGEAISSARSYLDRTDLSAQDRNAGLELLAVAQIANRQQADATQTLALLYSRDPGHRLTDPDASPPVLSAFARAREAHPPPVPISIEHTTPTLVRREPPSLSVRIAEGDDAVHEVRLVYRMGDEGASRVVMTRRADGTYNARIPVIGDAAHAVDVAYHIIALAPSGAELSHRGTDAEPLQLRIPAEGATQVAVPREIDERPPPIDAPPPQPQGGGSVAEEWWFWTIIILVVAGAAVTTGVLLGPAQEGPEQGTLGSVRLMSIELP
jgi:hypothetical protein